MSPSDKDRGLGARSRTANSRGDLAPNDRTRKAVVEARWASCLQAVDCHAMDCRAIAPVRIQDATLLKDELVALTAASVRLRTFSLEMMLWTWALTVLCERLSR